VVINIYENNTLISTTISGNNGISPTVLGKGSYSPQFYYMGYNVGQAQIAINTNISINYPLSIYKHNLNNLGYKERNHRQCSVENIQSIRSTVYDKFGHQ